MAKYGVGQSIKRFEDVRLVQGHGRYQSDVTVPGETHAVIVRSMHAHAKIVKIDTTRARTAPGVLAVFTGTDVKDLGTMQMTLKRKRPDGSPMFASPHRGLAQEQRPTQQGCQGSQARRARAGRKGRRPLANGRRSEGARSRACRR